MQIDNYTKNEAISLIESSHSIGIVPSKAGGGDAFGAALGLFHMLQKKYASDEKYLKLLYVGNIPMEFNGLYNVQEDILSDLKRKDLVVSIDYSKTDASKVAYSTHKGVLRLKVGPIPADFDLGHVVSEITNLDFDLLFVLGANDLNDLGSIYQAVGDEIRNKQIINIDIMNSNKRFGVVNIVNPESETLSSLVLQKSSEWGLSVDRVAAEALLQGIKARHIS